MTRTMQGIIELSDNFTLKDRDDSYSGKRTVTVKYSVDGDKQLMSYTVVVNRHVWHTPAKLVKTVADVPFESEKLQLAAIEGYFRDEYPGLPELKIVIDKGVHYHDGSLINHLLLEHDTTYVGG